MVDHLVRQDSATSHGVALPGTPRADLPGPDTPGLPGTPRPDLPGPDTPGLEWPRTARRFQAALRGHPYRQDTLLATIVFLLTLLPTQAGQPSELLHAGPLLIVTSVIQSVALIWRRPAPLATF